MAIPGVPRYSYGCIGFDAELFCDLIEYMLQDGKEQIAFAMGDVGSRDGWTRRGLHRDSRCRINRDSCLHSHVL